MKYMFSSTVFGGLWLAAFLPVMQLRVLERYRSKRARCPPDHGRVARKQQQVQVKNVGHACKSACTVLCEIRVPCLILTSNLLVMQSNHVLKKY